MFKGPLAILIGSTGRIQPLAVVPQQMLAQQAARAAVEWAEEMDESTSEQTLAARGISGVTPMLNHYKEHAPLKRRCDPVELGKTGVFLASDGAAAITGQTIYVDGGYQIMGM